MPDVDTTSEIVQLRAEVAELRESVGHLYETLGTALEVIVELEGKMSAPVSLSWVPTVL